MPETSSKRAAIFIESVTLRNFKGIRHLKVELQPNLTLLMGRNNAGKSRILRAIHIATGGARIERDDLTAGSTKPAEIDTKPAEIDVVLAPSLRSVMPAVSGSAETEVQGSDEVFNPQLRQIFQQLTLISTKPKRQRFAWRTTITSTSEGLGARSDTNILTYNQTDDKWQLPPTIQTPTRKARKLVHTELVKTRRDLDSELRQRRTAIRCILNDLQVSEENREKLEE